jgi:hypothetical protein
VSAKVVQQLLGRSSIVMTLEVYGHLFPKRRRSRGAGGGFERAAGVANETGSWTFPLPVPRPNHMKTLHFGPHSEVLLIYEFTLPRDGSIALAQIFLN